MRIHAIWRGENGFQISRELEREKLGKRLILDREYEIDIITRRNLKQHSWYWGAFLPAVVFHCGGTPGDWHKWLKEKFMPRKQKIELRSGLIVELEPHESFKYCTQEEMNQYLVDVVRFFNSEGYDTEEMIRTMEK
jgi:hypothetical protein